MTLAVLAGTVIGTAVVPTIRGQQVKTAPAYVIAEVETDPTKVEDPIAAKKYAEEAPKSLVPFGGQYLVRVGDCLSCHLVAGGKPFAGSLGLNTPFGVIYSANITPDANTGIGTWTADQFYRAMHDGIDVRELERG